MILGFIGGGNMATALIGGIQAQKLAQEIRVIEPDASKRQQLSQDFGVQASEDVAQLDGADAIILAVKPQQLQAVAAQVGQRLQRGLMRDPLFISIAAGVRLRDLSRWLSGYKQLVRVMPNTPALIGEGYSGLYAWPEVTPARRDLALRLLQAVGSADWLATEEQLDAITAVSGSGPAYVFHFIEALTEAALAQGFPAAQAQAMALATVKGLAPCSAAKARTDGSIAPSP